MRGGGEFKGGCANVRHKRKDTIFFLKKETKEGRKGVCVKSAYKIN